MPFTVAVSPLYRSSLEPLLDREVRKVLHWVDAAPADVVVAMAGEGRLAGCAVWPGAEGAAALVRAGFDRLRDRWDMERLHQVGRALASEQDLDRLLDLILTHGRALLEAEAGSLFLVQDEPGGRMLLFAHTQNAKVQIPFHRSQMPVDHTTLAGYVAATGECLNLPDVYRIEPSLPYRFNPAYDQQTGFRSSSMLAVPLTDTDGEVLGVLQFLNRVEEQDGERASVPFEAAHQRLAQSLAGQAGVAVKNARHRAEIEQLFEGFVNASITAIEQRDPPTRGHSNRVAAMTVGLAEAINRTSDGPLAQVSFTPAQLRELRYASLLHDFGKVGVREEVLVKAKKLPAHRLELLALRLRLRQGANLLERLRLAWAAGAAFEPAAWAELLRQEDGAAVGLIDAITRSNEPTVLPGELAQGLAAMAELRFPSGGGEAAVLEPDDLAALAIRKGSLSETERLEIESHVTHTYEFLSRIPWTADLRKVPRLAYAHHERPDGLGYPRRLSGRDIPVRSRAMAIADVFDALTAQDRPYKAALPVERSLAILEAEARDGHLDADLLRIFIEAQVFERCRA